MSQRERWRLEDSRIWTRLCRKDRRAGGEPALTGESFNRICLEVAVIKDLTMLPITIWFCLDAAAVLVLR
jgi:hypothetical protein